MPIKKKVGDDEDNPCGTVESLFQQEEVIVVSDEANLSTSVRSSLPAFSFGQSVTAKPVQPEEDAGFFIDSTPSDCISIDQGDTEFYMDSAPSLMYAQESQQRKEQNEDEKIKRQKKRIIKDDSIYISSDDDDDIISISSSEDIEMLGALSHWANSNIEEVRYNKRKQDPVIDVDMLKKVLYEDVCSNKQEEDDTSEDEPLEALKFDINQVPQGLRNGYSLMAYEEEKALRKEVEKEKQQRRKEKDRMERGNKKYMLNCLLKEFIEVEKEKYIIVDPTNYGRIHIIPALAHLFKLQIENNKGCITLTKTPDSLRSLPITNKSTADRGRKMKITKAVTRRSPLESGKVVGSDAQPISSNNIGHRMLAAMGWKEGDSIGNNGIKEPIKVTMRAKNRGLGA
ncbi:hypothetical protein G6F62_010259 [Rhizopus arrhizus]|nr:hypothetical protein G6F35_007425 [Rhizopus arrhizus]KAG1322412.1 hypothetical protein G6F62_010259 [Rhizopus arrhizus]